ncbi:MAG TPA: hypothetical protein VNU68_11895 [Verrucomicrobiae bacterium]|nr:hypothetical protein [Verrucomicrobiae bacterium]
MREFLYSHVKLEHLLCILILVSRLGDIGSTYLVTPKLKLEANPIVRKFGWWFAIATMLLCLIPYYSTGMGIIVLIPSLMVSASNTAKIWFARAYGESEYQELLLRLARKTRLSSALIPVLVAASFLALVGLVLLLLSPDPLTDWGYWFAFGFLAYAFVVGFYGSIFFIRLFRRAGRIDESVAQMAQQTGSPANGSRSETNSSSSAAGSRR